MLQRISDELAPHGSPEEVHTNIAEALGSSEQNPNEPFNHLNQKMSVVRDQLSALLKKAGLG